MCLIPINTENVAGTGLEQQAVVAAPCNALNDFGFFVQSETQSIRKSTRIY